MCGGFRSIFGTGKRARGSEITVDLTHDIAMMNGMQLGYGKATYECRGKRSRSLSSLFEPSHTQNCISVLALRTAKPHNALIADKRNMS